MKRGKRNTLLIFFISAAILFCIYLFSVRRNPGTGRNSFSNQTSTNYERHATADSMRNNDSLKIRKIKSPGADIPRKGVSATEIHRPAGPSRPAGAGKKAGAAKIKKN